jgi:hypothetical protein
MEKPRKILHDFSQHSYILELNQNNVYKGIFDESKEFISVESLDLEKIE